jgi:5'-nucleotidase
MKCLRLLTLLPLCASCFACLTGQQDPPDPDPHMNDTHSQFDPVNAELKGPLFGKQGETDTLYTRLGGYPRLLTMTKAYQAEALAKNQPLCCCTAAMPGRAAATSSSTRGWPMPSC